MEDEVIDSTVEEVAQPEVIDQPVEKSMDDTIRETLERIQSREEGEDRQRDEKGRFAPKQEQVAEEPEPVQEAAEAPQEAPQGVPQELQRLGLRKDEAEALQANPVALQAFMRRSEEMHKGLEQYRAKAQVGEELMQVAQPFARDLQAFGISPAQAFQKLMVAEANLRHGTTEQKTQMLLKMATDYGIDLGQAQQYQANQPYVDPQVEGLKSELNQMRSWVQQQQQAREWQERQTLNREISKFSQDPAHTHFEAVKGTMAGLLQAGLATTLQDAYEQAIYTNPDIRNQVLAAQQAQANEKRKAEAIQKANEAKRAAAVNISRRGVLPASRPVGSMEDTIRETASRLGIL